jgi:hypothetical protein
MCVGTRDLGDLSTLVGEAALDATDGHKLCCLAAGQVWRAGRGPRPLDMCDSNLLVPLATPKRHCV